MIDGIPGQCVNSHDNSYEMKEGSIDCFDRSDEKVFSKNTQTTSSQIEDDFNLWKDKPCGSNIMTRSTSGKYVAMLMFT